MATTALAVAFFIYKNQMNKTKQDITDISKSQENTHQELDNVDHTITADMQVMHEAPVIKVSEDGVENESEKWETKFFNNYIDETLKNLPSLEELQKLEEEKTHHTPSMVMETGLRLGKIKKQVKLNEEFVPKAMSFYENCASNDKGVTPVRGLCLANLIFLKKKRGEDLDLSVFPEQVRSLAKKAMEFSF